MIGFDVDGQLKELKKNLIFHQQVFTGEAKPNVIRLLPSLALRKKEAEEFLESLEEEINNMASSTNLVNQA
jgi:acetylornithine aminotransferase